MTPPLTAQALPLQTGDHLQVVGVCMRGRAAKHQQPKPMSGTQPRCWPDGWGKRSDEPYNPFRLCRDNI